MAAPYPLVARSWVALSKTIETVHTRSVLARHARFAHRFPCRRPPSAPHRQPRARLHHARLTLYAGASLLSVLFALIQPLSPVNAPPHAVPDAVTDTVPDRSAPDRSFPATTADPRDPSLPRFRLAEVRQHDASSGAPWVTSGDRVYDITDWVAAHPGGDVILRAAGSSIDPYWAIFTIHRAPHVREILESYLIGLVDAVDLATAAAEDAAGVLDPFAQDPVRDERLQTLTAKPRNAETPAALLVDAYTTPNELFYVRNHMWVPEQTERATGAKMETNTALTIERPDGETRTYSLAELRARFAVRRVTAVLQCSGNRRSDMTRAVAPTSGLPWTVGAIGNAVWEGVWLRDVLTDAGVPCVPTDPDDPHDPDDPNGPNGPGWHVRMTGREAYAASIPLSVALDPRADVLLAFGMNGQPLPPDHGAPLRAIVPGHVAARSVKWLARIVVADEEATSQWQRRDYKLFGPNEGAHPDWDRYPAIQELPVTSAITRVHVDTSTASTTLFPASARAPPGVQDPVAWQKSNMSSMARATTNTSTTQHPIAVNGYAYSGGGREIVRVDVSVDGGRTWDQAELLDRPGNIVARGQKDWAWKRWQYRGTVALAASSDLSRESDDSSAANSSAACADLIVKAVDSSYNSQPEHHDAIYNVRGNLATAWHRVRVCRTRDGAVCMTGCGFDTKT